MDISEDIVYHPIDDSSFGNVRQLDPSPILEAILFWGPATNGTVHWRTSYAFTADSESATKFRGISLDMYMPKRHIYQQPNMINNFGTLKLTARRGALTSSRTSVMQKIPFNKPITVTQLLDAVEKHNLQHYQFNADAQSGCLFWQLSLLNKLVSLGWIPMTTIEEIQKKIEEFRSKSAANQQIIPYPPVQGTFYNPRDEIGFFREYADDQVRKSDERTEAAHAEFRIFVYYF
ncbi:hypothetical protein ABKN59_006036 [Abortiporus biennis]